MDTPPGSSERLDSWKAIADYLQRDVRTVRRWEKSLGLPVRRLPGRGRSVFAYVSEIEQWLRARSAERGVAADADAVPPQIEELISEPPDVQVTDVADKTALDHARVVSPRAPMRRPLVVAALVLVAAVLTWRGRMSGIDAGSFQVHVTPTEVTLLGPGGAAWWRHAFPGEVQAVLPPIRVESAGMLLTGRDPAVLVGTGYYTNRSDESGTSGQLLWFSLDGRLERTFSFDERLRFGGGEYGEPWAITDFRVDDGPGARRVAVSAHHYQWYPSVVTVLDRNGRREGTFVNAGWVERLHWISPDRLLIAGFSNQRDAGMVAVLDANALNGQSPAPPGDPHECLSCADGRPLRYIALPRSELNHVTGARFNRAVLQVASDVLVVRTIETTGSAKETVDVLYEFTPSLELIRASYSDGYWDLHRALEAEGRIRHTRERCPGRDGPAAIEVWDAASGWRTVAPPRTAGSPDRP